MRRRLIAALLFIGVGLVRPVLADPSPPPRWDHDLELDSDAGYIQLRWLAPPGDPEVDWLYQLELSEDPSFEDAELRMEGHSTSFFISGLTDGHYHYRLRTRAGAGDPWSDWSHIVDVRVEHHSRAMAFILMGLGAFVFVATAGFLIAHRNDQIEIEGGRAA